VEDVQPDEPGVQVLVLHATSLPAGSSNAEGPAPRLAGSPDSLIAVSTPRERRIDLRNRMTLTKVYAPAQSWSSMVPIARSVLRHGRGCPRPSHARGCDSACFHQIILRYTEDRTQARRGEPGGALVSIRARSTRFEWIRLSTPACVSKVEGRHKFHGGMA